MQVLTLLSLVFSLSTGRYGVIQELGQNEIVIKL